MLDQDLIIETYKKLSTEELIAIADDVYELDLENIPLLQNELLNRNKRTEALALSKFLLEQQTAKQLSKDELSALIKQRIDQGEPVESIKQDLKDRGINLFDILTDDTKLKTHAFDLIASLKNEGVADSIIDQRLSETFDISESETLILREQLRKKGYQNLIIGYSMGVLLLLLIIIGVSAGANIGLGAFLLFGIAVWRIFLGHSQRR